MILDRTLTFVEDPTALTTGIQGDVIDLRRADSSQFSGGVMHVAITLDGAFTGDIQIDLMSNSIEDVAAGLVHDSVYVANAQATPGKVIRMAVNSGDNDLGQFLGIVGVSGTIGLITAALALDVDTVKTFPDAVN